jgi:hypothetical protein
MEFSGDMEAYQGSVIISGQKSRGGCRLGLDCSSSSEHLSFVARRRLQSLQRNCSALSAGLRAQHFGRGYASPFDGLKLDQSQLSGDELKAKIECNDFFDPERRGQIDFLESVSISTWLLVSGCHKR